MNFKYCIRLWRKISMDDVIKYKYLRNGILLRSSAYYFNSYNRNYILTGDKLKTIYEKDDIGIIKQINRLMPCTYQIRSICTTATNYDEEKEENGEEEKNNNDEEEDGDNGQPRKKIDPSLDRSRIIPVETSMKYLESKAYKTTYGNDPVWSRYRRNFKGAIPPRKTRPTCVKDGRLISGNPCPICRDEYLIVDYRNVKLLKQFVCQYTGKTLPFSKTNICLEQHTRMVVAIEKAKLFGILPFYIPFREYDYSEYYKPDDK